MIMINIIDVKVPMMIIVDGPLHKLLRGHYLTSEV